jgi:hypothetical protein
MKLALLTCSASLLALTACGGSTSADVGNSPDDELKNDACAKPALAAAEDAYGNDPMRTKVKALVKGVKYFVTVGIDNPEDGAHDYYVTFASGCSSKPKVTDVPWFPHPMRDATHAAYDPIIHGANDEMPSSYAVPATDLPTAAKTQYDTWKRGGTSLCGSVGSYKVEVGGKPTYAATCDTRNLDSIWFHIAIWDSQGNDIDQAAVYGLNSGIVDRGISWQNETFEETPH